MTVKCELYVSCGGKVQIWQAEGHLDRALINDPDSYGQFFNMARVQLTVGAFGTARTYVNRGQSLPGAPRD